MTSQPRKETNAIHALSVSQEINKIFEGESPL